MNEKQSKWVKNVEASPIRGLVLGSRFPDLLEMTGIDANKVDITILKHNKDVQIDTYRLFPHWHGQLSKYHNVFDGDQELAMRVIVDALRHQIYEAIAFSNDPSPRRSDFVVAAHSMLTHDINLSQRNLIHEVNWQQIELGKAIHMIGDIFAKTPLIVMRADRLIHTALPYSRFVEEAGQMIEGGEIFGRLGIDRGEGIDHKEDHFYRLGGQNKLDFRSIPRQWRDGQPYLQNGNNGEVYPGRYLQTTLAAAAIEELLEIIYLSDTDQRNWAEINSLVETYLTRFFSYDFNFYAPAIRPARVYQNMKPSHSTLPWYTYHHVDLWQDTNLDDIRRDGLQAFILPFSDRNSMDDIADERSVPHRTMLGHGVEEPSLDTENKIYSPQKEEMTLFASWRGPGNDDVKLARDQLGNALQLVKLPGLTDSAGKLSKAFAYIHFPKGVQLCLEIQPDKNSSQKARKAAFDFSQGRFRCRYGVLDGGVHHLQFHIPQGTRIWARLLDDALVSP